MNSHINRRNFLRQRRRTDRLGPAARLRSAGGDVRARHAPGSIRPSSPPTSHQPGRLGHRLFRQDGHGPGHRHRRGSDGRRRTRPADRPGQHAAGHRHQPQPGRRLGLDRHLEGGAALRNAAAEARHVLLRSPPKQLGVPIESLTVTDGVIIVQEQRGQESHLRRSHRRPLVRHGSRMERQDRQRAVDEDKAQLKDPRTTRSTARRSRAATSHGSCSERATTSPTSSCRACCMPARSCRRWPAPCRPPWMKPRSRTFRAPK